MNFEGVSWTGLDRYDYDYFMNNNHPNNDNNHPNPVYQPNQVDIIQPNQPNRTDKPVSKD